MTSLRQRRREQTTTAIRKAAIDLAHLHGIDQITTDMISEAAGISPRTFFNYFPYKEAALAPPAVKVAEADKLSFVQGKGNLLPDLSIFLGAMLSGIGGDRDTLCRSFQVSIASPKLQALQNALFLEFEDMMTVLLGQRLGCDPATADVRHMAAITAASVRMAFSVWVADDAITLQAAVRQRIMALGGLFQA